MKVDLPGNIYFHHQSASLQRSHIVPTTMLCPSRDGAVIGNYSCDHHRRITTHSSQLQLSWVWFGGQPLFGFGTMFGHSGSADSESSALSFGDGSAFTDLCREDIAKPPVASECGTTFRDACSIRAYTGVRLYICRKRARTGNMNGQSISPAGFSSVLVVHSRRGLRILLKNTPRLINLIHPPFLPNIVPILLPSASQSGPKDPYPPLQ